MEGSILFEVTDQYASYVKMFIELVKDNMDDITTMGMGYGYLGTHSFSKGVTARVASGYTLSPPIVLICICTGCLI